MTTIPTPRDVTEILRGVGSAEFPWKDPTLGTLLHRAADEIERLRALLDSKELIIKMLRANAAEVERKEARRG